MKQNNFSVYTHSLVPAGDGGIALGQVAVAAATFKQDRNAFKENSMNRLDGVVSWD